MKRTALTIILALSVVSVACGWEMKHGEYLHKGEIRIDTGGTLDVAGTLEIDEVAVTATAAELNTVDADSTTALTANGGLIVNGSVTIVEGALTDSTVVTDDIKDLSLVNADLSATADIALTKLACAGLGVSTGGVASVSEAMGDIVVTSVEFTNVVMVATDGSDEGESVNVFSCDDGAFTAFLVVVDGTTIVSAGATNTYALALGSAAAGDDSALTSTEISFCPSTTIDTTAGTVFTNDFDAVLAAPANFDGTTTGIDIFVNWAIADINMDAHVTNTVSGTAYVFSTKTKNN